MMAGREGLAVAGTSMVLAAALAVVGNDYVLSVLPVQHPAQIAQVTATLRVEESLGVPAEPLGSLGRPLSRAPVSM